MKRTILAVLLISNVCLAADSDKQAIDPFDVSANSTKVKELGVVTKPEVDKLEATAKELFTAGNCKDALPILEQYAKKSNFLANLISANLDPYYGASYDSKKAYSFEKLKPLIPLESLANDYKQKRNRAIAMQGECLLKTGNKADAIPVLLKALDLLDLDDEEWWKRTRTNLLSAIEVKV